MSIAHLIQLVLIAISLAMMIGGYRVGVSSQLDGDGGIGQAVIALGTMIVGAAIFLLIALWFVIGTLLGL